MAINVNDTIAFLRFLTVSKYNLVEKKISYNESDSKLNSVFRLAVLLKEISTVNNVRIKPAIVKEIVDKSETVEYRYSSLGTPSASFFHNIVTKVERIIAKK